ncbi:MAG TPA: response regulator [Candidatus Acidoferrales bacterium]|nr:response regulator [Candidatus Acidoferrales bacterium]
MAGEPILIVDDTPVSLNLKRLLLTREGYVVRTAAHAEEAIEMLGSFRPDLILADIRLPGMDGLEMARRIKKNPQTKTIKVIALTGMAERGDLERAAAAGCDQHLTRPVETQVLAAHIRQLLDRPGALPAQRRLPAPELPAPEPAFAELPGGPEVESLRRSFLNEGAAKTRQMVDTLGAGFDAGVAARLLHGWIGGAGLLGHLEISKIARGIEEMLRQPPFQVKELRECLANLLMAFTYLRDADEPAVPENVARALRGKRVALIGFTAECADSVSATLAQVGAHPLLFEAGESPGRPSIRQCDLVMVHVRPETLVCRWLDGAAALPAGMQLVLAGERRDLLRLPVAALARDAELLADPWHTGEVLLRLHMALNRRTAALAGSSPVAPASEPKHDRPLKALVCPTPAPEPEVVPRPKVVLADDDAIVLTVVGSTLQNYGMTCETANNGQDALRLIRETQPHVAVLDVNMPGLDGYEVLTAVRAENLPVAVILLTARQREGDILRGFQLGADDYLVKPFNPLELMARMKRLRRR